MTEHRWQGYSHEELHKSINTGPGPGASHASMERWAGVSTALTEINGDLHAGIMGSGAKWEGKAADQARAGLNPLASWADDAVVGADVMRYSAELQADHISKARSDMPPPVKVTAEQPNALVTGLTHLFGSQTDHEEQEQARDAAENRAREVMTTYASSTTSNTSTLGQFQQPPQLVINTSGPVRADGPGVVGPAPVFGFTSKGAAPPARRGSSTRGRTVAPAQPVGSSAPGSQTSTSSASTRTSGSGGTTSTSSAAASAASSGATGTAGAVVPGQARRKQDASSDATSTSGAAAVVPQQAAVAAAANLAGGASSVMGAAGTIGSGGGDTVHKRTVTAAAPSFDPFGTVGRGRAEEEEDVVHNAADYLRETNDIYGVGSYTLPVIGESTTD